MRIIKSGLIQASVINVVLGIVLFIWPGTSVKLVGTGLGLALFVYGVVCILRELFGKNRAERGPWRFVKGIVLCLLGVFARYGFASLLSILPFIFGIIVLVSGLVKLQSAIESKRGGYGWRGMLAVAALSIALGLLILWNPFSTVTLTLRVVGAVLFVDGASNLLEELMLRRRMDRQGYVAHESDDGVIDVMTKDK